MTNHQDNVLAVNEAFYRAFEKKDLEVMSQIWSQGTVSLCIHPGGKVLRGWSEVRDSWEKIFRNTSYLEIDLEIIATEISDEIAYVVVLEKVLQISKGRRVEAKSMATNIFSNLAQKWYLVHHHGSPLIR